MRTYINRACVDCNKTIRTYTEHPICHPCRTARREATQRHVNQQRQAHKPKSPTRRRNNYRLDQTTKRGYGWIHQKARELLIRQFVDGTPCPFCSQPMSLTEPLDLDHSDPASRQQGAPGDRLAHRSCNRRAPHAARTRQTSECEICGTHYTPNHGTRTCGRACGWELRRRNASLTPTPIKS